MCVICKDLILGNLTAQEAMRNLNEMGLTITAEHAFKVEDLIAKIALENPDPFDTTMEESYL